MKKFISLLFLAFCMNGFSKVSSALGVDTTISICHDMLPFNLLEFIGGNPDTGGVFIPALASGTYSFDPAIDGAGIFSYVHPLPSNDTSRTTIQLISCTVCYSNLVPNPSFENVNYCPTANNQMTAVQDWINVGTGSSTSDYFNTCSGAASTGTFGYLILPNTGNGKAGFFTYLSWSPNIREYIQVQLSSPLVAGECYEASMYLSLKIGAGWAVDSVGMYISSIAPGANMIQATPQVSTDITTMVADSNWQLVSGNFIAQGGEQYVTIGVFSPDSNIIVTPTGGNPNLGAYYLVDDVCVNLVPIDTITDALVSDTMGCDGTAITLHAPAGYVSYTWTDISGTIVSSTSSFNTTLSGNNQFILYAEDTTQCSNQVKVDTIDVVGITSSGTTNAAICMGDSMFLAGAWQNTAGTYYDTTTSSLGCDSIVLTSLSVLSQSTNTASVSICQGDSLLVGGTYQSVSGVYSDTLSSAAANGCDSIVVTTLSVLSLSTGTASVSICPGDSLLIGGNYQSVAGVYNDTLPGAAMNGCDSIVLITLTVENPSDPTITDPGVICSDDNAFTMVAATGGGTWTGSGITSASLGTFDPSIAGAGSHQVIYDISGNCTHSDTIGLIIFENPALMNTVTDDRCLLSIGSIDLTVVAGNPPFSYSWSNGTTTEDVASLTAGAYGVTVTDSAGCFGSQTIDVLDPMEGCDAQLWVANIFSPNGDGANDVLYARGSDMAEEQHFIVYDRWGQKVFESSDFAIGWDGQYKGEPFNTGVFVYFAKQKLMDGSVESISGNVTLIR